MGDLNRKISEIIAEEDEKEEQATLRGKWKRIIKAENRKKQCGLEIKSALSTLDTKGFFTLFLIVAFVFLLTLSVL